MKKRTKNLVIIIFPYLFIYEKEGFEIDKLKIKPSYKENVESEKEEVKKHLLNIAKLFRTRIDQPILKYSYTFTEISNLEEWKGLKNALDKFTTILRFSQLSDLKDYGKFDHFNYFVFEIIDEQLRANDEFAYYQGILNGEHPFHFDIIEKEVRDPYIPSAELYPVPFILTAEGIENNDYFKTFYIDKNFIFKDDEEKKILRAMEWFNRSFSHHGRPVDLSEALLDVHIAFEALLRPEDKEKGVKAQIKTALLNLLGHSEVLMQWYDEFWKLRNSIVHGDIEPESFLYTQPRSKKGHRRHLDLARKIFVECLNTILQIRSSFPLLEIEEELISNAFRINESSKLLKEQKDYDLEKLYKDKAKVFKFISSLRTDDPSASKIQTKEFGELFLPFVKKDLENNEKQGIKQNLIKTINKILEWQGNNLGDLALLYSKLQESYSSVYFKRKIDFPIYILALRGAAYNFFNFATWRLLTMFD